MLTPIEDMSERPAKLVQKSKEETPSSSFGSFSMSSLSGFGKVLSTAVGAENGTKADPQHARSSSGSSISFVGALSGVKSIMGGMAPAENQKSVSRDTRRIIDTFRLLGPSSHLGVVLAFDEMAQQPLGVTQALRFRFFRTSPNTAEPYALPISDLSHGWYTPCADDIGSVISVRCSSVVDEKVSRYISIETPLQADEQLMDTVHHAIQNNYFGVKRVVICSSRNSSRSNSMDSHESAHGRPRLQRSDSYGSNSGDLEVGGSIEISSEHVLVREKDHADCGLSIVPSPHIHVECVAPTSLLLCAPVHILPSPAQPINSINDLQRVKHKRMVHWLGPPRGGLFYGLKEYLSEGASHRRAASASMMDQISMTQLNSDDLAEHVFPGDVLRLTIVCRDRLTRDSLVMILRSMSISIPVDLAYENSIPFRLKHLPWASDVHNTPQTINADDPYPGDSGVSVLTDSATIDDVAEVAATQRISTLESEVLTLKEELAAVQSEAALLKENAKAEQASAANTELAELVVELQERLRVEEEKTAHLETTLSSVMIENSVMVAAHAQEIAALERQIAAADNEPALPQTPAAPSCRDDVASPQQLYRIEALERQLQASQLRCEALLGELSQVIIPTEAARYESPSVEVEGDYESLSSVGIMASGIHAMTRDSMVGLIGEESPVRDIMVRRIESFCRISEGDYQSDVMSLRDGVLRLQSQDTDDTMRKEIMDSMLGSLDTILLKLSDRTAVTNSNFMNISDTSRAEADVALRAPLPPSRSVSSGSDNLMLCEVNESSDLLQIDPQCSASNETTSCDSTQKKLVSLVDEIRSLCLNIDISLASCEIGDQVTNGCDNVDATLAEIKGLVCQLVARASDDLSKSTATIATVASLEEANETLKLRISSLQHDHQAVCNRMENELETLRAAFQEAAESREQLNDKHRRREEELSESQELEREKIAKVVTEREEIISRIQKQCESVCAELEKEKTKFQSLSAQHSEVSSALSVAQAECAKLTKECASHKKECARLNENLAKVQRNIEPMAKMKTDLESAMEEKRKLSRDITRIEGENGELVQYIGVLEQQAEESKSRIVELSDKVALLQAEAVHLSDDRQHRSKQMASYDTLRNQVMQLRSQLVESDQTLHATKNMLQETISINEELQAQCKEMESNLTSANTTIAKKSLDLVELHAQLESLEKLQKTNEKDKAGLRKENARLRDMMNKLEEDRESLYKLRPVYNEQFAELTRCRGLILQLEENVFTLKQGEVEKCSYISELEGKVINLEHRAESCLVQANRVGMMAEHDYHNALKLMNQLVEFEKVIKRLTGELEVARQAEPLKIKQLEYMLAKAVGEKNHFDNKAKSLSKDLQAKLLAGTPLQRELGRIMKRLEEVENERNAFRDAMMLSCDMYAPKDYSLPWLESLMK